ncbi:MAG: hypothetical protein ACLFPL_05640 [Candidatus Nanoarchaeia archaeon]
MMSVTSKTKKIINIIMFVLFALIIAGCAQTNNSGDDNVRAGGIGEDRAQENGAVDIEFVENNPPSEAFIGEPFDIAFEFYNYQMHSVDDMRLKITGFDRGNVEGIPEEDAVGAITAASETAGAGVKTDYFYEDVRVDGFTREFPLNMRIRSCYTQTSFRQQEICVPSQGSNQCSDDVSVSDSVETNGPFDFQIQRVNAIGDRVRIDILLENRLDGRVVDQCFDREGFSSEYEGVDARLGTIDGSCEPIGTDSYLFTNGRANFYCEFSRTGEDSYPSQLYLEASSLYEEDTRKNVMVRDPSSG